MGVVPLYFTRARPPAQPIAVPAFVYPMGATGVLTAASGTLVALRVPETLTTLEGRWSRAIERARAGGGAARPAPGRGRSGCAS